MLNEVTRGWERSAERPELRALDAAEGSGTLWTIDDDTLEGWVAIGRAIGPVPVDERAPLAVLGEILGTRLNIEAREIRGLANRATFFLPETGNGAGLLHIRTGGRLEAVAPLVKYCRDELAGLQSGEKAVTDEELALAKGILRLGKRQEALESARPSAAAYALATLHHGDTALLLSWPGEVEAVTADEVLAAARKYLDPQTMDTIVIGPIGRIHEARHPRWSVEPELAVASRFLMRPRNPRVQGTTIAVLLAMSATAQELDTVPVQELVLPNGFRLLVVEIPDAPRVATSLWYRVGGIGEAQGEHGSTHFLEHAIHQGTATVGTLNFEGGTADSS